jgi:hypothetical protein
MTYSESLVVENKQALTSDFHKGSEYDTLLLGKRSMTECKSIVMDLKKKIDDDSDETNPQLIRSLMYPDNTRLDSCHTVNVMSQARQAH